LWIAETPVFLPDRTARPGGQGCTNLGNTTKADWRVRCHICCYSGVRNMRSILTLLMGLMAFWLSACSTGQPDLYRSSNEQRIYEDGRSVNITNVESEAEARPFAEQYCGSQNKTAHFQQMELLSYHHIGTMSAVFDCASPPQ